MSYGCMGSSNFHTPPGPMYGMCMGAGVEGGTKGSGVAAAFAPGGTGAAFVKSAAGCGTLPMKPGTLTGLNRLGVKGPTILTRRLSVTRDIMTYSRPGEKASRTCPGVAAGSDPWVSEHSPIKAS